MILGARSIPVEAGIYQLDLSLKVSSHTCLVLLSLAAGLGAASVTLEYKQTGASTWVPVPSDGLVYSPITAVRAVVTGALPAAGNTLMVVDAAVVPEGLFLGTRAATVQNYTEANVKHGVQYQLSNYTPALAAGGMLDYIVEVGAKPISIKGRMQQFDGQGIRLEMYKSPIYTGGSALPYYNSNTWNPQTGLGVIRAGMTVTDVGVKCAADMVMLGSNTPGSGTSASNVLQTAPGLETILEPNAEYLFRTVSIDANPQRVFGFATWYEGDLDFNR